MATYNNINDLIAAMEAAYLDKSNTSPEFIARYKTLLTKNITINDWNAMYNTLKNNSSEVYTVYNFMLETLRYIITLENKDIVLESEIDNLKLLSEGLRESIDNVENAVGIISNVKQSKTDEELQTDSKLIVGAINELLTQVVSSDSILSTLNITVANLQNAVDDNASKISNNTFDINTIARDLSDLQTYTYALNPRLREVEIKTESLENSVSSINLKFLEYYTIDQVNAIVDTINNISTFKKVATLPPVGDPKIIYLLPAEGGGYDEYFYIDGEYELLGALGEDVNLDDYPTRAEVTAEIIAKLSAYQTKEEATSTYNSIIAIIGSGNTTDGTDLTTYTNLMYGRINSLINSSNVLDNKIDSVSASLQTYKSETDTKLLELEQDINSNSSVSLDLREDIQVLTSGLENTYDKSEVDTKFTGYYNKTETDELIENAVGTEPITITETFSERVTATSEIEVVDSSAKVLSVQGRTVKVVTSDLQSELNYTYDSNLPLSTAFQYSEISLGGKFYPNTDYCVTFDLVLPDSIDYREIGIYLIFTDYYGATVSQTSLFQFSEDYNTIRFNIASEIGPLKKFVIAIPKLTEAGTQTIQVNNLVIFEKELDQNNNIIVPTNMTKSYLNSTFVKSIINKYTATGDNVIDPSKLSVLFEENCVVEIIDGKINLNRSVNLPLNAHIRIGNNIPKGKYWFNFKDFLAFRVSLGYVTNAGYVESIGGLYEFSLRQITLERDYLANELVLMINGYSEGDVYLDNPMLSVSQIPYTPYVKNEILFPAVELGKWDILTSKDGDMAKSLQKLIYSSERSVSLFGVMSAWSMFENGGSHVLFKLDSRYLGYAFPVDSNNIAYNVSFEVFGMTYYENVDNFSVNEMIFVNPGNELMVSIKKSRLSEVSIDGFAEYVAANPLKSRYKLNVPTVEELPVLLKDNIPVSNNGIENIEYNNITPETSIKYLMNISEQTKELVKDTSILTDNVKLLNDFKGGITELNINKMYLRYKYEKRKSLANTFDAPYVELVVESSPISDWMIANLDKFKLGIYTPKRSGTNKLRYANGTDKYATDSNELRANNRKRFGLINQAKMMDSSSNTVVDHTSKLHFRLLDITEDDIVTFMGTKFIRKYLKPYEICNPAFEQSSREIRKWNNYYAGNNVGYGNGASPPYPAYKNIDRSTKLSDLSKPIGLDTPELEATRAYLPKVNNRFYDFIPYYDDPEDPDFQMNNDHEYRKALKSDAGTKLALTTRYVVGGEYEYKVIHGNAVGTGPEDTIHHTGTLGFTCGFVMTKPNYMNTTNEYIYEKKFKVSKKRVIMKRHYYGNESEPTVIALSYLCK